jgi:hypothetical protein
MEGLWIRFFFQQPLWEPVEIFPSADEDLLLHLSFMGNKDNIPTYSAGSFHPQSFCYALASFGPQLGSLNKPVMDSRYLKNASQKTDDGTYLEATSIAALATSSRCNGLSGANLMQMMSHVVYHMSNTKDAQLCDPTSVPPTFTQFASMKVPYLSAPNAPWPIGIPQVNCQFANLSRTVNKTMCDGQAVCVHSKKVLMRVEDKFRSLTVSLSDLEGVVSRLSSSATVQLVFATEFQPKYYIRKRKGLAQSFAEYVNNLISADKEYEFLRESLFVCLVAMDDGHSEFRDVPGITDVSLKPAAAPSSSSSVNVSSMQTRVVILVECKHLKGMFKLMPNTGEAALTGAGKKRDRDDLVEEEEEMKMEEQAE